MKYLKFFSFIIALNFIKSSCFAMDVPMEEPIKTSIHHLPNMGDIHQYLGDKPVESVQKRARTDEGEGVSDLKGVMVVFDFDEALGYKAPTDLGPDFARDCRLFSCEMYREDKQAFEDAVAILNKPFRDFENRLHWCLTHHFSASFQYHELELSTRNLLKDLRKRGATLLVCSGNLNDFSRTSFLKRLGFEGEKDYFHEPKDKTRPLRNYLTNGQFSKVLFVDNRRKNVEDFVQNLRTVLAKEQNPAIEITGLHYDYFHRTLSAELLVKQFNQIDEHLAEKKRRAAEAAKSEEYIVKFLVVPQPPAGQ